MIPVGVRQEQREITISLGKQSIARFTDSRTGINQKYVIIAIADLQAGCISAIAQIAISRGWYRSPGPPAAYDHIASFYL